MGQEEQPAAKVRKPDEDGSCRTPGEREERDADNDCPGDLLSPIGRLDFAGRPIWRGCRGDKAAARRRRRRRCRPRSGRTVRAACCSAPASGGTKASQTAACATHVHAGFLSRMQLNQTLRTRARTGSAGRAWLSDRLGSPRLDESLPNFPRPVLDRGRDGGCSKIIWTIEDWGQVLGDTAAAGAILDRFLHHAEAMPLT